MAEYRVSWKRAGNRPKTKIYQSKKGAERMFTLLGPTPWVAWGEQPEDYFCCNGYECGCGGETVRARAEGLQKVLPPIEWIKLEVRDVSAWQEAPDA